MTASAEPRWKKRPPGSNWGDFGPDDQLGRINLIRPHHVRAAVGEVREGITFCLSLPLDRPGGNVLSPPRLPPVLRPTLRNGRPRINYALSQHDCAATDHINDDSAILHTQYSTHWDSLAHIGFLFDADDDGTPEIRYYNGYCAADIEGPSDLAVGGADGTKSTSRATKLGIQHMAAAGVQARGVMVDLRHHYGDSRTVIGYDKLMRVLEADKVAVEEADIVCFHTGFTDLVLARREAPTPEFAQSAACALDGRDTKLLDWITRSNAATLVADNFSIEEYAPATEGAPRASWPLHEHCLFKLGMPFGELWHLTPLAKWLRANGRSRFLLTAPPLRLPGAIGSPTTPIATV